MCPCVFIFSRCWLEVVGASLSTDWIFVCAKLNWKVNHGTVRDMLFQQANLHSVWTPEPQDARPLLVINAVVTPESCPHTHTHTHARVHTLASCHVLWQLVCCFAISCKLNSGPAPTDTERQGCWVTQTRSLAHSCCCVSTSSGMSASMTRSLKKTKEYSVFDSFSTGTRHLLQSALPFFFRHVNVRHTMHGRLFSFSLAQLLSVSLSCIAATPHPPPHPQQHISCLFLPLLSFSCGSAIHAFSHDYNASSRPPSAIHWAFSFHSLLLTLLLNCVRPML